MLLRVPTWPLTLSRAKMTSLPSVAYGVELKSLVLLTGMTVCLQAAPRGSSCQRWCWMMHDGCTVPLVHTCLLTLQSFKALLVTSLTLVISSMSVDCRDFPTYLHHCRAVIIKLGRIRSGTATHTHIVGVQADTDEVEEKRSENIQVCHIYRRTESWQQRMTLSMQVSKWR